jgi:hypothetical protein
MYPNLFKSKYAPLRGRAWVKALSREDLKVFIEIGLQANQHGRLGGLSTASKPGHMAKIGRIGAIVTNSKRLWNRLLLDEMEKIGVIL